MFAQRVEALRGLALDRIFVDLSIVEPGLAFGGLAYGIVEIGGPVLIKCALELSDGRLGHFATT